MIPEPLRTASPLTVAYAVSQLACVIAASGALCLFLICLGA